MLDTPKPYIYFKDKHEAYYRPRVLDFFAVKLEFYKLDLKEEKWLQYPLAITEAKDNGKYRCYQLPNNLQLKYPLEFKPHMNIYGEIILENMGNEASENLELKVLKLADIPQKYSAFKTGQEEKKISSAEFKDIINTYGSSSRVLSCFFSKYRSEAIRELRLLKEKKEITHKDIENALVKDSNRRVNLFNNPGNLGNRTGTDEVIIKLRNAFKK